MRISNILILLAVSIGLTCPSAFAKEKQYDTDNPKYYDMKKEADPSTASNDPWTGFNQPIFSFNLAFDRMFFKPLISAYDEVPAPVRHDVSNFLQNLSEPLNCIHGILQLNPKAAFTSLWRFILNTTFGLGGLRDFAREEAGLHAYEENLGKTLGHWGVPAGPYVVLPILGPSSVRDTTGRVGDWFADPIGWVETTPETIAQVVADGIDTRDSKAGVIDHLYYQSLDPYIATRSAYRQHESFEATTRD